MVSSHGLAAAIRAAHESETFDLGGQNATTIATTMEAAFATPFTVDTMIRITLITGAGKQARQKYDDAATKTVTLTLQKYGYVEDQGASCVWSSAGSYKLQHDTNKNTRTVVVFPKVAVAAEQSNNDTAHPESSSSLLPVNSPGYKIAVSSMNVFPQMIQRECPSWFQKKSCLESIHTMRQVLNALDAQLIQGTPLTNAEQFFYDHVATHLEEKEEHVKQQAAAQVEQGKITKFEKDFMLQQNQERIAALAAQHKSTQKALERKKLLESIDPQEPHPLKHYAKIAKLRKELVPLLRMEQDFKGRLLTIKETKEMARKDEILEEIQQLEEASRGWFEDDDAFASRVQASRNGFSRQQQQQQQKSQSSFSNTKSTASEGRSGGTGSVTKWVTPTEGRASAKKKAKMKKGGKLFEAMMMEESSDEEEEEDNEQAVMGPTHDGAPSTTADTLSEDTTTKKKPKKKKKKGKSKSIEQEEEELLTSLSTAAQEEANKKKEEENQTALAQVFAFLQAYVFPLIAAILGWIIGLVFGKPKNKVKRKQG